MLCSHTYYVSIHIYVITPYVTICLMQLHILSNHMYNALIHFMLQKVINKQGFAAMHNPGVISINVTIS